MAGVAPQRSGGSNATTIGMVVSIVVNVALIAVLAIYIAGWEDLKASQTQAVDSRNRLGTTADESKAREILPDAGAQNRSFLGEAVTAIKNLTGRITGNPAATPAHAEEQLNLVLQEIRDQKRIPDDDKVSVSNGAVTIIRQLHEWYTQELDRNKALADEKKELAASYEALQKNLTEIGEKVAADVKDLKARVASIAQSKEDAEELSSQTIAALKEKQAQDREQLSRERQNRAQALLAVAQDLKTYEELIEEQEVILGKRRGRHPAAEPLAAARQAVGQVLRTLPGASLVHIDKGRVDGVTLGMTFTVYSQDERIADSGRGKATLEIVAVDERTSETRVIDHPSPDNPILVGDPVGNIILSRNKARKQEFCIVGQFDLDYDGSRDPRAYAMLEALVHNYGGVLSNSVTATTDYLIVGMAPPVDEDNGMAGAEEEEDTADEGEDGEEDAEASDEFVDPTSPAVKRRMKTERQLYEEAIERAQAFAIPRLTQDQFLNFTGIKPGPKAISRLQQ